MEITLPQTATEAVPVIIALLTLAGGLSLFFMPRLVLGFVGLQPDGLHPEAIGEGRSSFAGFLIAVPLGCLLFQQPSLQQPGLYFAFACCWLFSAIGKTMQIMLDGTRQKRNFIRTAMAYIFGLSLLWLADPVTFSASIPSSNAQWLTFICATVTVAFGIIAMFLPAIALRLLKLQVVPTRPAAIGEVRGNLAGFYLGLGLAYLLAPGIFLALTLALAWSVTAFGRMISMLSDRGNTFYNWLALVIELILAALPIIAIFGLM